MEVIDKRTSTVGVEDETASEPEIVQVPTVYATPVPVFNNVLIKADAEAATFAGTSFIIPDTAKQKVDRGVVVAVSDRFIVNGQSFPMRDEVKEGDIATFNVFNATPKTINGEEYQLVSIFDVVLVEHVSYAPLG